MNGNGNFIISDKRKLESIRLSDIIRLESRGIYTIIFLKNKEEKVCSCHLKAVQKRLDDDIFIRIHKSHVVNSNEIKSYEKGRGGYITMSDGTVLPIAQRQKAAFIKKFYKK